MHRNVNSNCLHCLLYGAHSRVAFVTEKFNPNRVAGFHELHFGASRLDDFHRCSFRHLRDA